MRILSRLVLLLVFAAGLSWPAQGQPRDGEQPCPSRTAFLACVPDDALAALRALASADAPCHVKVVEASGTAMPSRGAGEPVVYAAHANAGRGLPAEAVDPPPRA